MSQFFFYYLQYSLLLDDITQVFVGSNLPTTLPRAN